MMFDVITENEKGLRQHRTRLEDLLKTTDGLVRIASAYVTETELLAGLGAREVRLLTSLLRMDIITGASSLDSLRSLIEGGVHCRCVTRGPRLHAKVYIFGEELAVVTSANLTWNALDSNIEAGVQLGGNSVKELGVWFDTLWKRSVPLDLKEISRWQQETHSLRSEYAALRKKAMTKQMPRSEARPALLSPKQFDSLFDKENRFFVCNTDRRWSPVAEKRMRQSGYAAAWEDFRHPSHMQEVESGNAIFMYAKGVGILAIGQARGSHEVLQPGNPERLRKGSTPEWRIPVNWLAWEDDDADAFGWNSPNATFFEVSDDKYRPLRDGIERHFSDRL